MEVNTKTIVELFSEPNFQFITPVYQRNYAWEESTYHELFIDLVDLIPDDLRNQNVQKSYFLGTLILKETESEKVRSNWIIDGQQRLTTFFILICAIKDCFKDHPGIVDWCNSLLLNQAMEDEHQIPKLKLKLVKTDNDVLESILKLRNHPKSRLDDDEQFSKLQNVMDDYCSYVQDEFFSAGQPNNEKMQYFIDFVLKRIQVVQVLMGTGRKQEENEQEIFDRINATGTPLTFRELLCNFLLMGNTSYNEMDELYRSKWLRLENLLDNDKKELDEFLNVFFATKFSVAYSSGSHDAKSHKHNITYSSFKNWYSNEVAPRFSDECDGKKYVFDELLKFCNYYLIMTGKDLNSSLVNYEGMCSLLWLNMLHQTIYYPLVLKLMEDLDQKNITNETFNAIVAYLLNYLVRISLLPDQKGLNSLFLGIYRKAIGKDKINNATCFKKIKELFNDIGKYEFVSDANFKHDLHHNPVSDNLALTLLLICHYGLYPTSLNLISSSGIKVINIFPVTEHSLISYEMEKTLPNKAISKENLLGKNYQEKMHILLSGDFKDLYLNLPETCNDFNEDIVKKHLDEQFNFLWQIIANIFNCNPDVTASD